jgi:WD40 repeat protein
MADVFISYSRKDKAFVQVLHQALAESKYDAWIDWQDIPPTADWWAEIEAGIEAADAFLFVISPDSVASQVCNREVDYAVTNHKRFIPIMRREGFGREQLHSELSRHNWLYFREQDDFDSAFAALVDTLNTDLAYVKAHTRLLVKTLEWEHKQRRDDLLLRGDELTESERWVVDAIKSSSEPAPTEQQKAFIGKSREVENAHGRLIAAGDKARRMVRLGAGILAGTIAIASVIGILTVRAFRQLEIAKTATQLEREGNLALQQMDDTPLDALLMAVRSGKALQGIVRPGQEVSDYPTTTPVIALRTILDNIQEQNKIRAHEGGAVEALSLSPDGTLIATAGFPSAVVKIWNLAGELVTELEGHNGFVNRVQFSPDGKVLATGGNDGTVRIWTVDGQLLKELTDDFERVLDIGFNTEGDRIITSSQDGMVRIWTLDGTLQNRFTATASTIEKEHSGIGIDFRWDQSTNSILITSVFDSSPAEASGLQRGDRIVAIDTQVLKTEEDKALIFGAVGESTTLTIARKGEPDFQRSIQRQTYMTRHPVDVSSVMFSADGQQILTGDRAGHISLWRVSGEKIFDLKAHSDEITQALFRPDGTQILSIGRGDPGKLWSLEGQLLEELPLNNQLFFKNAAFSPDGQTIATVGEEGVTELWNLNGEQVTSFRGHNSIVFDVEFSADGKTLVTGELNGIVRVWNLTGQTETQFKAHAGRIYGAEFSPDGQQIITVTAGGSDYPKLWTKHGQQIHEFRQEGVVHDAIFSPDGQSIATTSNDGVVRLWNTSGELKTEMDGHRSLALDAAFSPDGKTLASVGADETARLWTLSGEEILNFVAAPNARVYSVDFSPDGQYLATSGQDGIPRLWALDGKKVAELIGHEGGVNVVQFSPDGQQILTAGQDSTVRLWTMEGDQIAELRGHQGEIWVARFSPTGEQLLSAGEGGTVRLWTSQGMQIGEFRTGQRLIPAANFSPDGKTLLIGGGDGMISMFPIESRSLDELLESGCEWLGDYLANYPTVKDHDRALCRQ